jgi:hypothetical protein
MCVQCGRGTVTVRPQTITEQEQLQQQALEQMKQLLGMEHILQSQKIAFAEEQRPRNQPSHQRRRR